MLSRTKNLQSAETILAMVSVALGRDETPATSAAVHEFEQGWFNAVYRVQLRSGRRVVLKIGADSSTDVLTYERDMLDNEIEAMRVVSRMTTVAIPQIEYTARAGGVIEAPWFIMSNVEGENLGCLIDEGRLDTERRDELLENLGAANRQLNALEGRAFGSIRAPQSGSWYRTFAGLIDDLIVDARRAGLRLGSLASDVRNEVERHSRLLDEVTVPRFVAWDLWPGNAIAVDGGITVIDHERSLWGDPAMEAAFINDDIPIYPHEDAFRRGYGSIQETDHARRRRRLYALHRLLVMAIEPAFRGVQDLNQAKWSEERIRAILNDPGLR